MPYSKVIAQNFKIEKEYIMPFTSKKEFDVVKFDDGVLYIKSEQAELKKLGKEHPSQLFIHNVKKALNGTIKLIEA